MLELKKEPFARKMVSESHQGVGNEKDGNEYQIPIGIQHNMKKKKNV